MALFDFLKRPVTPAKLSEPQTASIINLQNQWHDSNMAAGLSPARLNQLFLSAAQGNLHDQAQLFEDMLERDAHLYAEMDKRKSAPTILDFSVVPPRNANTEEQKLASYAEELLRDLPDFEDIIKALMDGVGHGYSALEITWNKEGNELLPTLEHRPQDWFQLNTHRTELRLRDGTADGAILQPFSWILHTHGLAKTGYLGRMPLYRVLAWPFLYKLYGISDFAEFLETYGLPIIIGKYQTGTDDNGKRSLERAVRSLGHDARAVMPADMQMEIKTAAMGSNTGHLDMVSWADKSQSKCILGATLTSQADGKTSTNALGSVHNDVRTDIRNADCRQIAGTLTRDLIYPFLALNKGGIDSLRRCPRLVFDTGEAEDLALYADSLPKLVSIGMKIPSLYAHNKLKIPQPEGGEAVLGIINPNQPALAATTLAQATLSNPKFTQQQQQVEAICDGLLAQLGSPVDAELIDNAIKTASNPEDLEHRLAVLMRSDSAEFNQTLELALFKADVLGYVHAQG